MHSEGLVQVESALLCTVQYSPKLLACSGAQSRGTATQMSNLHSYDKWQIPANKYSDIEIVWLL